MLRCCCFYDARGTRVVCTTMDRVRNFWSMWRLMGGERKGLKLIVWTCITLLVVVFLVNGNGSTVSVVCGAFVIAVGVLTLVLIVTGHDPWWTDGRKARQASKKHGRSCL
jgi:hypothetical protein